MGSEAPRFDSRRFLKRNETEFRRRKTKILASKRADPATVDEVKNFCAALEASVANLPLTPGNCVNYDETRLYVSGDGVITLERVDKHRPESRGSKGTTIGTLVTFILAEGMVLLSVIIIAGEATEDPEMLTIDGWIPNKPYPKRNEHPMFFATTKTGYSNTALNGEIIAKFVEIWTIRSLGLAVYVFSDQLAAHYHIDTVKEAFAEWVLLWSLPSNTSHFLQPLDGVAFAMLKLVIHQRVRANEFLNLLGGSSPKEEVYGIVYDVIQSALTPEIIRKAFDNTNLCPFRSGEIIRKAYANIGYYAPEDPSVAQQASTAMETVLHRFLEEKEAPKTKVVNRRTSIAQNSLHDPSTLIAHHDLREEEKTRKELAKEEKKQAKELKKNEQKEEKKRRTCQVEGCTAVGQKSGKWSICSKCQVHFCPKHHTKLFQHTLREHTRKKQ